MRLSITAWLLDLVYVSYAAQVFGDTLTSEPTVFIANAANTMLIEWQLDQDFTRFALVAAFPLWFCVSLVCSAASLSSTH